MNTRFGLALTLAVGFGLTACAAGVSPGPTPGPAAGPGGVGGQLLQQGERIRQTADTRNAQRALDLAVSTEDSVQARIHYQQALEAAQAAIAADATNPLPQLQAGIASVGVGNYVEADRYLARAEELRPIYFLETEGIRERAWIDLYQKAAPLVNAGEYEAAAAIFENANAIYDRRPEVRITLGQIYGQLRRTEEALANLDRALAIIADPEIVEAMDAETVASWQEQAAEIPLTRALILNDAGRFEEAIVIFEQLVERNPEDLTMRRNLAALLVQTGNMERAFQVYESILGQPGLGNEDYYAIGVGFYQGGDYGKAASAFEQAARLSRNDRDAIEMWARSLQIDSQFAQVPPAAERWIQLDPANQNAMLILAQAVNNQGDVRRAEALVRQIEALTVGVNDLQMQRREDGARVVGSVVNNSLAQGSQITLGFTFYDAEGNSIGTQALTLTLGPQQATETFELVFSSTRRVEGYGYTVIGG